MKKHFNISYFCYAIGLFVTCFAVSLYNTQNPLTNTYARGDSSVYQYIGQMMRQGILPYRDIFDHKGPIVYLWNMMGGIIHPTWGQWLLEFLLLLGSAALAFLMAHKYLSSFLSFLITATVIILTPKDDTIGNTESLSVFLNFAFLYYCLQIQSHIKRNSFILGLILALQLFIKPTHAMMGIIYGTGIFLKLWIEKRHQLLKQFLLYASTGCLSASEALLLILWLYGILPDFYHSYIIFNLQYTPYWKTTYSLTFINSFYFTEPLVKLSLGLTGLLLLYSLTPNTPYRPIIWLNTSAVLAIIFLIIMPHNPLKHYTYMLSPTLFTSLALFCLCYKKYPLSVLVFLIFFFIYGINQTATFLKNNILKQQDSTIIETVHFLQNNLKENEPFTVLGYDMCRLHLLSKHPSATHYPMNSMVNRIMPEKLFTELKQAKPKFILLRKEEISHYKDNFITYWPDFINEYQLITQNSKYHIFMRTMP